MANSNSIPQASIENPNPASNITSANSGYVPVNNAQVSGGSVSSSGPSGAGVPNQASIGNPTNPNVNAGNNYGEYGTPLSQSENQGTPTPNTGQLYSGAPNIEGSTLDKGGPSFTGDQVTHLLSGGNQPQAKSQASKQDKETELGPDQEIRLGNFASTQQNIAQAQKAVNELMKKEGISIGEATKRVNEQIAKGQPAVKEGQPAFNPHQNDSLIKNATDAIVGNLQAAAKNGQTIDEATKHQIVAATLSNLGIKTDINNPQNIDLLSRINSRLNAQWTGAAGQASIDAQKTNALMNQPSQQIAQGMSAGTITDADLGGIKNANPEKYNEIIAAKNQLDSYNQRNSVIADKKPDVMKVPDAVTPTADLLKQQEDVAKSGGNIDLVALHNQIVNNKDVQDLQGQMQPLVKKINDINLEMRTMERNIEKEFSGIISKTAIQGLMHDRNYVLNNELQTTLNEYNALKSTYDLKLANNKDLFDTASNFLLKQQDQSFQTYMKNLGFEQSKQLQAYEYGLKQKYGEFIDKVPNPFTQGVVYFDKSKNQIVGEFDPFASNASIADNVDFSDGSSLVKWSKTPAGIQNQGTVTWIGDTSSVPTNNGQKGFMGGFEVAGSPGQPIKSETGGTVIAKGTDKSSGNNFIEIQQQDGTVVRYNHLQSVPGNKVGSTISTGDQIGNMGNSGNVAGKTGVHLNVTAYPPERATDRTTNPYGTVDQQMKAIFGDKYQAPGGGSQKNSLVNYQGQPIKLNAREQKLVNSPFSPIGDIVEIAKQIANGQISKSDLSIKSQGPTGNLWNQARSIAVKMNPNADNARIIRDSYADPTKKAGAQASTINTAMGHLGDLYNLIDGLQNGDYARINAAKNSLSLEANLKGAVDIKNFDNVAKFAGGEVMKYLNQGHVTDASTSEGHELFQKGMSPEQLKASVQQVLGLMSARMNGYLDNAIGNGVQPNTIPGFFTDTTLEAMNEIGGEHVQNILNKYNKELYTAEENPEKKSYEGTSFDGRERHFYELSHDYGAGD